MGYQRPKKTYPNPHTFAKQLEDAWHDLQDVFAKYSSDGALDSEPRYVLYNSIELALAGEAFNIPDTVEGWQLYSGTDAEVAKHLYQATREFILFMNTVDFMQVRNFATKHGLSLS